jgi:hypothetical protein
MAIQPITEGAMKGMQKNGGNVSPENGPYFMLNFNPAWNKAEDEDKFFKVVSNVIDMVKTEAKRRLLDNDYCQ